MRRAGVGRAQTDAVSSYMPELRMAELHSAAMLALTFTRRARELGFTLDQVRTLLKLSAKVRGPFPLGRVRGHGWTQDLREANKGTSPDDEVSSRGAGHHYRACLPTAICMP